jgi:hypothetical protein
MLLKGNRFVLKFWVLQRAMLSHRLFARSIMVREYVLSSWRTVRCETTDIGWSTECHRLHFQESISNNQCRSDHGGLQSIHLLDVCVYHLHPEAVDREGRRSIIDRSIGTIGVGRWRSFLFSATASSPHQSSPYDVFCHRCKSVIYHELRAKWTQQLIQMTGWDPSSNHNLISWRY